MIIDSRGVLTRELWVTSQTVVYEELNLQANWQLVPTTFEGVVEWVFVKTYRGSRDWTRCYSILYRDPGEIPPTKYQYPLVVRIQGFIKSCNLTPMGNWNG